MKSIKSVYKIGHGPSSSHTVGPYGAARLVKERYPRADGFEVTLYGSLALTGAGHGTGKAIKSVMPDANIILNTDPDLPLLHPNTMRFRAFQGKELLGEVTILSIGGGSIRVVGEEDPESREVYPENSFHDIAKYCRENDLTLLEYIKMREGEDLMEYLRAIWQVMIAAVKNGLDTEGILPGELHLSRKAKLLKERRCHNESSDVAMNRTIASYAFAVSEENAAENLVVTAPTCGSCGVIPSVLYYFAHDKGFTEEEILDALAVAGLFGNLIRTNASISGAECGCQAEIGSACSMAAAAYATLEKLDIQQTEYAAEIAMEHNLGLTCDPVCGLVQIPCIERNAVAAMRAISSVNLARFLVETRKISFDDVVATMYATGRDMNEKYRETAHGGLAVIYKGE